MKNASLTKSTTFFYAILSTFSKNILVLLSLVYLLVAFVWSYTVDPYQQIVCYLH